MISVIIPVYNGELYIEETLKRILTTTEEIEVILVDDGSTDNSREIYNKIAKEDNRIKIVKKSNGGIAEARNYGLAKAKGEYICFCDQDDYISDNYFEKLKGDIEYNNCDLVISNPGSIKRGEKRNSNSIYHSKVEKDIEKLLLEILTGDVIVDRNENGIIWTSIWNCLFKKSIIDENNIEFCRFVDYEDDTLFLINYLTKSKTVYLDNENLYYWREHDDSESHRGKYINEYYEKMGKMWEYIFKAVSSGNICFENMEKIKLFARIQIIVKTLQNECQSANNIFKIASYMKKISKEQLNISEIKYIKERISKEYLKILNQMEKSVLWTVIRYKLWLIKSDIFTK